LTPRARNLNQLGQDEQNDVDDVFVNTVSDDMYLAHTCDPDAKRHSASKASPLQPDLDTKKPDVAMMGQAIFAKQHQVRPCVPAYKLILARADAAAAS